MIRRDWRDAQNKLEDEAACRVCDKRFDLEKAHVSGRKYDRPRFDQKQLYVDPRDIVILCGPALDTNRCHYKFDHGQIDLQEHLSTEEQARCVEVLGSIENARMRLAPSDYKPEINAARVAARVAA